MILLYKNGKVSPFEHDKLNISDFRITAYVYDVEHDDFTSYHTAVVAHSPYMRKRSYRMMDAVDNYLRKMIRPDSEYVGIISTR